MVGRQITGVLAQYQLAGEGDVRFLLNGDQALALDEGRLVSTPGLVLNGLTLVCEGDKSLLADVSLILTYRAAAQ